MNWKRISLMLAVIAMMALVTVTGCKKKEEPVVPTQTSVEDMTKTLDEASKSVDVNNVAP